MWLGLAGGQGGQAARHLVVCGEMTGSKGACLLELQEHGVRPLGGSPTWGLATHLSGPHPRRAGQGAEWCWGGWGPRQLPRPWGGAVFRNYVKCGRGDDPVKQLLLSSLSSKDVEAEVTWPGARS